MKLIFNNMVFPNPIDDGTEYATIGNLAYNEKIVTETELKKGWTYTISVSDGEISNDTRLYIDGMVSTIAYLSMDTAVQFTAPVTGYVTVLNKDKSNSVKNLIIQIKAL